MRDWTQEYNQAMIDGNVDHIEGERRKKNTDEFNRRLHEEAEKARAKKKE